MGDILFLCHRIPYPPNKGDKIRAYHWLRALAAHHRVHLGTFVDDPADWSHREALDGLGAEQCYRPLPGLRAKARSLNGLWRGEALSFGYYRDRAMTRWVRRVLGQHPIDAVFVFSSTMAPYALDAGSDVRRVLDFVDVDSDKWQQYAGSSRLPMRWVYAREAKRLFQGERALAARFDASVFVSEAEADFFRRAAPEVAGRVHALGNGVDADYFDPGLGYGNPYENETGSQLVFTGAMDYGANADAMVWFVEAVLPRIRETRPEARLSIVGTRPTARVRALASHPGVQVTGAVPDVRPYLAHADAAIAPMRIARGIEQGARGAGDGAAHGDDRAGRRRTGAGAGSGGPGCRHCRRLRQRGRRDSRPRDRPRRNRRPRPGLRAAPLRLGRALRRVAVAGRCR